METIYLICFLAGGTLLVCQLLLSLLGLGGHHDIGGHEHDVGGHDFDDGTGHELHPAGQHDAHHEAHHEGVASWFVGMLTYRTVVAALTFFGLAGLAANREWGDEGQTMTLLVALAAGAAALFVVGSLMRMLSRLKAEGTVRMERAVGRSGTVYLPIPGQKAGAGRVMLNLQNRTVECQAITAQQELLPTGAQVVVVAVVSPDTVEVAPAPASGE